MSNDFRGTPFHFAAAAGATGLRLSVGTAVATIRVARALEGRARRAAVDAAGHAGLGALDAMLASPYTDEAVARVLRSPAAERAVAGALDAPLAEQALAGALSGPLIDALARDVGRYSVVERLTDELLTGDAIDHAFALMAEAGLPERLVEHVLADGIAEQILTLALNGPEMERLLSELVDSRLPDQLVTRLLESEEMWMLVEEIVRSPAVTQAITQQSLGFADQVGDEVRRRSGNADAWVERAARRIRLRHRDGGQPTGPAEQPSTP